MIGLTSKAAENIPALAPWLNAIGLEVTLISGCVARFDGPVIRSAIEAEGAATGDVLVEIRPGEPALQLASRAGPHRIAFGLDNMAMGHALIAALVCPAHRPACGEPESARQLTHIARVAASDVTVLVQGETGTGKEGIARYVHACSARRDAPFVAVNCAALPETMLEAILFGHRRGAFTGAAHDGEGLFRAADGGTLLLDEIGELPLSLQAKLLRALQEREILPVGATRPEPVDVRVIACGNRELATEVAEGRFRADLFWRLNVIPVQSLPLRQRRLDVRAIVASLLVRHARRDRPVPLPTPAALDALLAHDWPGNARELENCIQRALVLSAGHRIEVQDLHLDAPASLAPVVDTARSKLSDVARAAAARAIRTALEEEGGNRIRAASRLGISERTLRYRLAEYRAALAS